MFIEKTPLCRKVIPWRVQKCCRAFLCTVEKAVCCPSGSWVVVAHTEEGPVSGAAASIVAKQLLDVLELQGCAYIRVEVKGISSKHPFSLPCSFYCFFEGFFGAFYLTVVMSSMHGLLCFYLFDLSKLLLQIEFPFIIHAAHSSLQPCSLLFSLTQEDTSTSGLRTGSQFQRLGAQGFSRCMMARPTALPSQEQWGEPRCKPSKPQQSTKPHRASFGSRAAQGSETFSSSICRLWSGITLELPRESSGGLSLQHLSVPRAGGLSQGVWLLNV